MVDIDRRTLVGSAILRAAVVGNDRRPHQSPTIGYLRDQGVRWVHVSCTAPNCLHGADLKLDAIGLPDDTPFPAVASRRRWVCARCGCRKVHVHAEVAGAVDSAH